MKVQAIPGQGWEIRSGKEYWPVLAFLVGEETASVLALVVRDGAVRSVVPDGAQFMLVTPDEKPRTELDPDPRPDSMDLSPEDKAEVLAAVEAEHRPGLGHPDGYHRTQDSLDACLVCDPKRPPHPPIDPRYRPVG